jgi:hypothetical protein
MGLIDAASSGGSNPGLFVAIWDILPESSPLFHADSLAWVSPPRCVRDEATVFSRVDQINLEKSAHSMRVLLAVRTLVAYLHGPSIVRLQSSFTVKNYKIITKE